jgi:hypothetical protein
LWAQQQLSERLEMLSWQTVAKNSL